MANVKLSQIASGGAFVAATDAMVTVRNGNTDVLTTTKVVITQPATGSTLTIQDGFTLTASGNAIVSGTNTGDQTITLTGDVTGSGTGSFAATIANGSVTAAKMATNVKTGTIGCVSSNTTAVTTGKIPGFVVCPYSGTITAFNFVVDGGTATISVWKIATGTAKPTAANSINTSGVSISTGTALRSTTLTDFTSTTVTSGDIFAFNISAISGVTEIDFQLEITKS